MSSYTKAYAVREFEIIKKTVKDPIIAPFEKEILALVDKFGNSGQSGGSAPYTAGTISQVVKKLCLHEPITPLTCDDDEWIETIRESSGKLIYQNKRLTSVFKLDKNGKPYYLDAIVFQGEEDWDTFTGSVYIDEDTFELIRSRQFIKCPFKPKTFYIDVIRKPITKEEAEKRLLHYIKGNDGCYYTVLKDKKQLNEVFEYYEKPEWFKSLKSEKKKTNQKTK